MTKNTWTYFVISYLIWPNQIRFDCALHLKILFLEDIQQEVIAERIITKYGAIEDSTMRWALKPIMAMYLLDRYEKALVLDADLYFVDEIGLKEHLSPTRANGLVSMIKQMKLDALAFSTLK